ncbi:GNAT family N-acetyltransferase [Aliidiomarina sedimenti]|uniref:GNAT family N-acetyltransferase n=1 Tax=Aliidiomarina sedimenti TaxID=1933879 RepID=A0ABY0C139_9GAMM|nr:GNAT family N-acetyltransferase [Aliidiomarina sedimenti]RUO30888.1 GNAT family N-acetyltransferase [Aliidiomarina sedimenti]
MLEIRAVDYSDQTQANELLALLDAYARDPMGGGEALPETTKATLIAEMAKRDGVYSFIAYKDGQAVGLANCVEGFSTFAAKPLCNIHDIAVLDGHRGEGIAQQLMDKVCEAAKARGCCKVTLEVLTGNESARHAYLRFGFKPYQLDPTLGQAEFWEYKL